MRSRSHLALLPCLGLLACGAPADAPMEEPVDPAAVRAELDAAWAAWSEAAMAEDLDAISGLLSPDVRIAEPGIDLAGDEVREFLTGVLETSEVTSFERRPFDVFIHGDAAYEMGEYDETITTGDQVENIEGYYFVRWERGEDGAWQFDRIVAGPRAAPGGEGM